MVEVRGALVGFLLLVLVSGCILGESGVENETTAGNDDEFIKDYLSKQAGKESKVAPTASTSTTSASTSTSTTTLKAALNPCTFECCNMTGYEPKPCGKFLVCKGTRCAEKPCPYDCCVLGMFEWKECRQPLECVNSKCVRPQSPTEYECCSEADYIGCPSCAAGYECIGNHCFVLDTDKDGLADVVEGNYGTNENTSDTDGDGLSDIHEVKVLHTNPLSMNTDLDRYGDSVDSNPTRTDSAAVTVKVLDTTVTPNLPIVHELLMHLDFNQPQPSNDSKVADFESNVYVLNNGTDYTNYLNYTYTIGYWCAPGINVTRKSFVIRYTPNGTNTTTTTTTLPEVNSTTLNESTTWDIVDIPVSAPKRLEASARYISHQRHTLKFQDLPEDVWAAIVSMRRCYYNTTIENVRYEYYPGY
ncbi:MAG: hypothetical protein V1744_06260 [Candidatus Altiarchaeota archaeon]